MADASRRPIWDIHGASTGISRSCLCNVHWYLLSAYQASNCGSLLQPEEIAEVLVRFSTCACRSRKLRCGFALPFDHRMSARLHTSHLTSNRARTHASSHLILASPPRWLMSRQYCQRLLVSHLLVVYPDESKAVDESASVDAKAHTLLLKPQYFTANA